MIKNERHYQLTRVRAQKFEQALAQMRSQTLSADVSPVLHKAEQDALQSQLTNLQQEIDEFQAIG